MSTAASKEAAAPGSPPGGGLSGVPGAARETRLLALLQALADERRLRILEALAGGEACVCELQEPLGMGQSLVSHHLKVLREAGLVRDRKQGRWIHYSLVPGALREVEEGLGALRTARAPARSGAVGGCGP